MTITVTMLSAMMPFYGILTANYKDVLWMTAVNIAILALICVLVLKIRKDPAKLCPVLTRAFAASLAADAAAVAFRFLPSAAEWILRLCGAEKAAGWLAKYVSDFTWYEIWAWWNSIGLPWTFASIFAGGVAAFALNYWVLLKKLVPERKARLLLSILLGVFSAPYSWTNPAW